MKTVVVDGRANRLAYALKGLSQLTERVSVTMFFVLFEIYKEEGKSNSDYAERTGLTLAGVHRHIANLKALDFLISEEKKVKGGGRAKFSMLTPKGRAFCEKTLEDFYGQVE